MARKKGTKSVLVVGLGRFGSSVASTLNEMEQDVLAVDKDPEIVARWSSQIPVVQADMTDVMAIERIDASQFDTAVVAIGDSIEASVIAAGNLLDAGITDLWAKSVSIQHARILRRIGARHVINAESDAGKRIGHLVSGNYLDYIEIEGMHTVVKVHTPQRLAGQTIAEAEIHDKYGIVVVGVKSPGREFQYGENDTVMRRNDELIIAGRQSQIDMFLADCRALALMRRSRYEDWKGRSGMVCSMPDRPFLSSYGVRSPVTPVRSLAGACVQQPFGVAVRAFDG